MSMLREAKGIFEVVTKVREWRPREELWDRPWGAVVPGDRQRKGQYRKDLVLLHHDGHKQEQLALLPILEACQDLVHICLDSQGLGEQVRVMRGVEGARYALEWEERREMMGWHRPHFERFKCNLSSTITIFLFSRSLYDFYVFWGKSDPCLC